MAYPNREIQEVDIMVVKDKCLGMGKRFTWHLERVENTTFNLNTILESLEHISYPVNIKLQEPKLLGEILADNLNKKTPC